MSTRQTPLHPAYFPSLLSTRRPQLSFSPLRGPSLLLPQGLCTGRSYPLVHPSLSSSHSQTFPVIHILLKYHLLRKKVPDNPSKKTHSHNPTLSSKPLLVSEMIDLLPVLPSATVTWKKPQVMQKEGAWPDSHKTSFMLLRKRISYNFLGS